MQGLFLLLCFGDKLFSLPQQSFQLLRTLYTLVLIHESQMSINLFKLNFSTNVHQISLFQLIFLTFLRLSNQSWEANFSASKLHHLLNSNFLSHFNSLQLSYFIHNPMAGCKVASQRKCRTEDVAVCAFSPALIVPDAFHSIFNLGLLCSYSCMATLSVANS